MQWIIANHYVHTTYSVHILSPHDKPESSHCSLYLWCTRGEVEHERWFSHSNGVLDACRKQNLTLDGPPFVYCNAPDINDEPRTSSCDGRCDRKHLLAPLLVLRKHETKHPKHPNFVANAQRTLLATNSWPNLFSALSTVLRWTAKVC